MLFTNLQLSNQLSEETSMYMLWKLSFEAVTKNYWFKLKSKPSYNQV